MIFKLNDYNAFLTSLFDKNNEQLQRHQSHQLQNYNQSQNSNTIMTFANNNNNNNRNNSNINSEIADDENNTNNGNTYHQNGGFPVDFDFGLAPPPFIADLPHNNTNNGNGNSNNSKYYSLPSSETTTTSNRYNNIDYELPSNTEFIAEIGAYVKDSKLNNNDNNRTENLQSKIRVITPIIQIKEILLHLLNKVIVITIMLLLMILINFHDLMNLDQI